MKEKKSNVITTSDLKTNYLKTNLLKQIKKYLFSMKCKICLPTVFHLLTLQS